MPLTRFSAPGNLKDFATDAQAQAWSKNLSDLFESTIAAASPCVPRPKLQFASPMAVDTAAFATAEISWPGFPAGLVAGDDSGGQPISQQQAYQIADGPMGRSVQDEYLEWYIHTEGGEMTAVDFTTETEHYWETLFGMDPNLAAKVYGDILGTTVHAADISKRNKYDPANAFNTTKGIVHLIHPNNTLGAELDIACQSTISRTDGAGAETNDVVSCLRCRDTNAIGGANRNSDPKIANQVSLKADDGCLITIPDPVGLYIARIDTTGWVTPDGSDPQACFKIVRGAPGVRARFEVPGGKFKISDIKIGADPIRYAGQIAECVFVKLSAAIGPAGLFQDRPQMACSAGDAAPSGALAHRRSRIM